MSKPYNFVRELEAGPVADDRGGRYTARTALYSADDGEKRLLNIDIRLFSRGHSFPPITTFEEWAK